jgi:ABC-type bacteriocin/lantibiotic exporter with double-glycine peptidase domain
LMKIGTSIPDGSMVAILGASGSGKTTLIRLLGRLLPLVSGDIRFGVQSIRTINEPTFRKHVGVVLQSDTMFRATVQENLSLFSPEADLSKLTTLCQEIGAHDFIMAHKKGYSAIIGEDRNFSVGQQRRLALIRALLREPKVLLLDEPTAGLDVEAEQLVVKTLAALAGRMTIVIATHSPLVASHCSQAIVLDHGRASDVVAKMTSIDAELLPNKQLA